MLLPTSAIFVTLSSLEEVARSLAHVRAAEAATRRRRRRRSRSVGRSDFAERDGGGVDKDLGRERFGLKAMFTFKSKVILSQIIVKKIKLSEFSEETSGWTIVAHFPGSIQPPLPATMNAGPQMLGAFNSSKIPPEGLSLPPPR